jgi:protein-S-isoprenylcysteine O-methyltransferase Ste14
MSATDFELRHQTLLHFLLVSLAFLTYLFAPDDIVWAFVKGSSHPHLLERSLFAVASLLIGAAATICTWARAYPAPQTINSSAPIACDGPYRYLRYPNHLGNLLFAVGLGSLAPLPGFVILVAGQALLDFRLIRRAQEDLQRAADSPQTLSRVPRLLPSFRPCLPTKGDAPNWTPAFRQESAKWGLFLTMIIFTVSLVDRVAEVLALASLLLWLLLNLPLFIRPQPSQ